MGIMKRLWQEEQEKDEWENRPYSDEELDEMYQKYKYDEMNEQGLRQAQFIDGQKILLDKI